MKFPLIVFWSFASLFSSVVFAQIKPDQIITLSGQTTLAEIKVVKALKTSKAAEMLRYAKPVVDVYMPYFDKNLPQEDSLVVVMNYGMNGKVNAGVQVHYAELQEVMFASTKVANYLFYPQAMMELVEQDKLNESEWVIKSTVQAYFIQAYRLKSDMANVAQRVLSADSAVVYNLLKDDYASFADNPTQAWSEELWRRDSAGRLVAYFTMPDAHNPVYPALAQRLSQLKNAHRYYVEKLLQRRQLLRNEESQQAPVNWLSYERPDYMERADKLPRTTVEWESEVFDFGTIGEGTEMTYRFNFQNTGKHDLLITQVKASCGCTTPAWSKDPLKPNEKGFIEVKFNSKGKAGLLTKTITVTANFEGELNKTLKVRGEVRSASGH